MVKLPVKVHCHQWRPENSTPSGEGGEAIGGGESSQSGKGGGRGPGRILVGGEHGDQGGLLLWVKVARNIIGK